MIQFIKFRPNKLQIMILPTIVPKIAPNLFSETEHARYSPLISELRVGKRTKTASPVQTNTSLHCRNEYQPSPASINAIPPFSKPTQTLSRANQYNLSALETKWSPPWTNTNFTSMNRYKHSPVRTNTTFTCMDQYNHHLYGPMQPSPVWTNKTITCMDQYNCSGV